MIISKTPFRISFVGGGTDIPSYFKKNGGQVLVTTIDKFSYHLIKVPIHKRNHNYNISYSKINNANKINNIKHPVIREILKIYKINKIDIHHDSDLPGQSGLGTSSAFGVGLLNCICKLKKIKKSKLQIAEEIIDIERNILKEKGGFQDQISASYGGFNKIVFKKNGKFKVKKINIKKKYLKELQNRILITLIPRKYFSYDHSVAKILNQSKVNKEMKKIHELSIKAERYLLKGNISTFARIVDESWNIKSKFKNTSNKRVDEFYKLIKKHNYIDGGKLLGAGGGGYFMLIAKKNRVSKLKDFLKKKNFSTISPMFSKEGSKIIYEQF